MLTELSQRPKTDQRDFSNSAGFRVIGDTGWELGPWGGTCVACAVSRDTIARHELRFWR